MNPLKLAAIGREFAELDFTDINDRLSEERAQIARLEEADRTAQKRLTVVARELRESDGPNGEHVAAALLAGQSAREAANATSGTEALEAERDNLLAGREALRKGLRDAHLSIDSIKADALRRLNSPGRAAVEHVMEYIQAGTEMAATGYAALAAINYATKWQGEAERQRVGPMVALAMINNAVLPYREIEVPKEIRAMLSALEGKSAALPNYFVSVVTPPSTT